MGQTYFRSDSETVCHAEPRQSIFHGPNHGDLKDFTTLTRIEKVLESSIPNHLRVIMCVKYCDSYK